MKLLIITQKVDQNDQLLGFSIEWFRRFAEKFDFITILCLEKGEFDLPDNVKVISLGKDRGLSKIRQLFTFYFLVFGLRKDYDAVFSFMNAIWIVLGAWLWRLLNKKIYLWYAHKTITWKHRLAEMFSDGIFTSTREGFRVKSDKVMIVGQGIDTDVFKPVEGEQFEKMKQLNTSNDLIKILSVGRIAPIKNYEVLISAVKILIDKKVNLHVTVVGEPVFQKDFVYEQKLKKMVSETGLDDHISFIGKVVNKKLPSYFQSSDLFINLGKTGSLDKTIVEAMACGINVISSNDAASKFLPEELVVGSDNAQELAEKIREIAGEDFGERLRKYVLENHSLKNLIEKISSHIKT